MTTKREVLFGNEAKEKLRLGAEVLSKSVACTLGALGRNVVIKRANMLPHVTKDGVTVARAITPADPIEAIGADILRQAAIQTGELAGDGTSTSTVLAMSLINMGLDAVLKGEDPIVIKQGIESGVKNVVAELKKLSKPVENDETLLNVATISANNDPELGKIIADVVGKVGKFGVVKIENSHDEKTFGKILEGMIVDSGWSSPYFANNNRMEAVYDSPLILVCDMELTNMTPEFVALVEMAAVQEKRPFILIAKEANGALHGTLTMNKQKNGLPVVVIKAPNVADIQKQLLEDICIATGATMVGDEVGLPLKNVKLEHFGQCERIIVSENDTAIIKGAGSVEAVNNRVEVIKHLITEATNERQKAFLERRIANIKDGVGVIFVGAVTEAELLEKKDRVDDAVCATKAAQEEGIVAGGGTTLLKISQTLTSNKQNIGEYMVYDSITSPYCRILENAGIKPEVYGFDHEPGIGIDVKTNQKVNMVEAGIIDPTKVVRVALENAGSVACLFLTTECVSYETEVNNG